LNFETINFELKPNGIGIITLNRPEKLNAISFQMEEDLHEILDHLMSNLDCRVVIFGGMGRAFCAGTDLQEGLILNTKKIPVGYEKYYFLNVPEPLKKKMYHQWRISQIYVKMRKISQPIIAIIHGAAAGGGFGFAMAADMRIASEDVKFINASINIGLKIYVKMRKISQPIIAIVHGAAAGGGFGFAMAADMRIASEDVKFINASINIGLTGADVGGSYFLPRLIGMSRAAEILYSGKIVDGIEAEKIGLVLKVVKKENLLKVAIEKAEELLKKSPLGLRMTKQAINLSLDSPSLETILQFENSSIVLTFSSKDVNEASAAFFEKRDPKFPLR
jgi:enoyl-CoA hydratase/carnithine racemase